MDARLRQLRSALQAARRSARTYPATLQRQVAEVAVARRGAGHSLWSTAEAVGLGVQTVQRWVESVAPPTTFRAVEVMPEVAVPVVADESLVLVTSQGHRVEGLTADQVVSVLRGLAR